MRSHKLVKTNSCIHFTLFVLWKQFNSGQQFVFQEGGKKRAKNQFLCGSLWAPIYPYPGLAALATFLFPLGCHSSSAPPVLCHIPFPVSFLFSFSLSIPTTPPLSPSPHQSDSCGTDWARGSSPHQRLSAVECEQATEAPISRRLMSPLGPLPPTSPPLPQRQVTPLYFQWRAYTLLFYFLLHISFFSGLLSLPSFPG